MHPDLIFLDMQMPHMDGPEFLLTLENHPFWNEIPVVLLTAGQRDCSSRLPSRYLLEISWGPETGASARRPSLHSLFRFRKC